MAFKVLIAGLGLIGGSLGLALKDSPAVKYIMGFDQDASSMEKALRIGAIDYSCSFEPGIKEADLIIICTPLGSFPEIIKAAKQLIKPGAIISDVGSTKAEVMQLFSCLPDNVFCIGGHPMAGAETAGITGADRYLFENAVYVLTPAKNVPAPVLHEFSNLLKATGAKITIMEPAVHDRLVSTMSHIPHLTATALVNLTQGDIDKLMMAAGGFRDTTRIASSSPDLWVDILLSNRGPLINDLEKLIQELTTLKTAMENGDRNLLQQKLSYAKEIRDRIPYTRKGLIPTFSEIICIVPDKPGIIGYLGQILGHESINIVDIEILRVREGDGGTIRLGVRHREDAQKAVSALADHSIKAWIK